VLPVCCCVCELCGSDTRRRDAEPQANDLIEEEKESADLKRRCGSVAKRVVRDARETSFLLMYKVVGTLSSGQCITLTRLTKETVSIPFTLHLLQRYQTCQLR